MPSGTASNSIASRETQSELISLIYDAAAAPDLWPQFLERLAETMDLRAVNFVFTGVAPDGAVTALPAVHGFDESAITEYEQHYSLIDPHRLPALAYPTGAYGPAEMLLDDHDFIATEYYNDFYSRVGLRHGFATVIHSENGVASVMACHRGPEHGVATEADLAMMGILTPHLMRARKLSAQLGTLQSQQRVVTEVLDRLPVGLVFVDAAGSVLRVNARGEEILMEEDGLRVRKGQLVASSDRESRNLSRLIAAASDPVAQSLANTNLSLRVGRPSGRRDLDVMACPVAIESTFWSNGTAAAFLVVSDGHANLEGAARRLQELYMLSETEAKVAVGIASGATVKELADEREVSVETVRWQLKQVFAKTGTQRQPDLIRLVLLGPPLATS